MGKAANRRKQRRAEWLIQLYFSDREAFEHEMRKRVNSWIREINRRAYRIFDENGNPVPAAFSVVDDALRELSSVSQGVLAKELEDIRRILEHQVCLSVSRAMGIPSSYRLMHEPNEIRVSVRSRSKKKIDT